MAVFDARWIKPLPEKQLLDLVARFDRILFAEENALAGGFSSAVLELLVDNGTLRGQRIKRIGLPTLLWSTARKPSSATALALMTRASI